MSAPPHLVITGLMGVGKSTVATAVSRALGRAVRDSDVDIETLFGRTGRAIAADEGVDELHRLESAVLLGALASDQPLVISAAAWVVEDVRCREALARRARVVVLKAPTDEVLRRIAAGDHRRAMDRRELEALAVRRRPLFDLVADTTVDAVGPVEDVAAEILRFLKL
jgi:shikimate kinase